MKKLLILMLAICLVFCLAACGDNTPDGEFEKPEGDYEGDYEGGGDGGSGDGGNGDGHTHAWGSWTVSLVPTYEAGGTLMRYCPDCPWASETRAIPKLDTENYIVRRLWGGGDITCAEGEVMVYFLYQGQDENGDFEIQVWIDEHYSVPHTSTADTGYTLWTKENHYRACTECGTGNADEFEAHTMVDGKCTVCGYFSNQLIYNEDSAYSTGVTYNANEETVVIPPVYGGSNPLKAGFEVTSIGSFENNTNLVSLTIPSTVTFISNDAFYGCTSLTNVYYEGTWEDWFNINFIAPTSNPMYYASHFFMRDENGEWAEVKEITIPDTITEIKEHALVGFVGIEKLTIPVSVTKIGNAFCDNFSGCHFEHSIYDDNGNWLGSICDFDKIYYGGSATDWCKISRSKYAVVNEKTDELYLYEGGKYVSTAEITEITIPAEITKIPDYMFSRFSGLQRVFVLGALTEIGEGAFYKCGELVEVNIGVGCKKIGRSAFQECVKLDTITLPADLEQIYYAAFNKVDNIDNVYFNGTIADWCKVQITSEGFEYALDVSTPMRSGKSTFWIKDGEGYVSIYKQNHFPVKDDVDLYNYFLVIPESVTEIGQYQFYGFDLDESVNVIVVFEGDVTVIGDYSFANAKVDYVFLPKSVKTIGYNALSGSIDGYTDIYYTGSPAELDRIGSDSSLDLSVLKIHFYAETASQLLGVGIECWYWGDDGYVYEWVYSSSEDKWVAVLTKALSLGVFTD